MERESRPLWGIILGVIIIAALGGLFFYGQKQRMAEETDAQKTAAEEKKAKDVIVIGGIVPLSGIHSTEGQTIQKTADLAVAKINAAGGVNKRPIEMVWEDGRCNDADAAAAAQKLVTLKEAKYVIGGFAGCEEELSSILSVTEQHGALLMSPAITHTQLGLTAPGLFLSLFDTSQAESYLHEAMATYAVKNLHAKKAAVINDGSGRIEGEDFRITFREAFLPQGGEIVIDHSLEIADIAADDLQAALSAIKKQLPKLVADIKKSGVEVIFIASIWPETSSFIFKELASERLNVPIIGTQAAEVSPDDVILFSHIYTKDTPPDLDPTTTPVSGVETYSIPYLLKDAITAVGNNPEKVRNFLLNLRDWRGPLGTLNFNARGDRAIEYRVDTFKNGVRNIGTYSLAD